VARGVVKHVKAIATKSVERQIEPSSGGSSPTRITNLTESLSSVFHFYHVLSVPLDGILNLPTVAHMESCRVI